MKYIKGYKIFESNDDSLMEIMDCYQELLDEFNLKQIQSKDSISFSDSTNDSDPKSDTSFTISKGFDENNPGTLIRIKRSSIKSDNNASESFNFIKESKFRRLVIEGHRRSIAQLDIDNSTIYSMDGEFTILYYKEKFRFTRSDLSRYYRSGYINKEKYDILMKDAIPR